MADKHEEPEDGIGLADAIRMLRAEVLSAHKAAAGTNMRFPVESMVLELKIAATRSADGKAGFCVPFVNVELGASTGWERERMQTVTVTFGKPVDDQNTPIDVSQGSDDLKE